MGSSDLVADLLRMELQRERTRRGLSQAKISEAVSAHLGYTVHPSAITKIENGTRDVRVDELNAFAEIFGTSVDVLLGRHRSSVDVVWAAGRLTSNAGAAVADLSRIQERLKADLMDLHQFAVQEHKRELMQQLLVSGAAAVAELQKAQSAVAALANEFPLPGVGG